MKLVVHFKGGLGNQLIQYAYAFSLLDEKDVIVADISHYRFFKKREFFLAALFPKQPGLIRKFSLIAGMYAKIVAERGRRRGFLKSKVSFLDNYIDDHTATAVELPLLGKGNVAFIDGYFQELPLFPLQRQAALVERLNTVFDRKELQTEEYRLITSSPGAVMLHLRCGDYLSDPTVKKMMGTCSKDYYKRALQLVTKGLPEYRLFIFSDDIEAAKEFFADFPNKYFVKGDTSNPTQDFSLMRLFNYAVIPNSTLSYMACMLSHFSNNIVAVPKPWFNDGKQFLLGTKQSWIHVDKE